MNTSLVFFQKAYLEALVNSSIDLKIDSLEIQTFFDKNKSLFKLNEDIFKMVYIELPLVFSDTYQIRSKIRRFKPDDQIFLDSVSYRYKNFSLTADKWVTKKKLFEQFPFMDKYSYKSLKNYNFYQFKDSLSLYLIKIIESVDSGGISPIEHVFTNVGVYVS